MTGMYEDSRPWVPTGDWFLDQWQIQKSISTQVHTPGICSFASVDSTNCRSCGTVVFIENNPSMGGSTQFKPMLFKGQLYILYVLC